MANTGVFDGLVLALERGEISEREFYAALAEAKKQRILTVQAKPKEATAVKSKVQRFRPSLIRQQFFGIVLVAGLIALVPGRDFFFAVFGVWLLWARFSHSVTLKDGLIFVEDGFIAKRSTRIRLVDIRSVDVSQTVWQRLNEIGDVRITSSGDSPERVLRGIDNPFRLAEALYSSGR